MARNKNEFLAVFEKALGNVSVACKNFGMDRVTFYDWYNNDADFRAKADAVKEIRKDFIESALDKRIIFAAKTQCKDRGYTEKMELDQKQTIALDLDEQKTEIRELIKQLRSE